MKDIIAINENVKHTDKSKQIRLYKTTTNLQSIKKKDRTKIWNISNMELGKEVNGIRFFKYPFIVSSES